jgi:hypothetical protein
MSVLPFAARIIRVCHPTCVISLTSTAACCKLASGRRRASHCFKFRNPLPTRQPKSDCCERAPARIVGRHFADAAALLRPAKSGTMSFARAIREEFARKVTGHRRPVHHAKWKLNVKEQLKRKVINKIFYRH